MRLATASDVPVLVALMRDFYAEAGYELDQAHAAAAFAALLAHEPLGRAWLVEAEQQVVGYLVLTFGFGMEYGGRTGVLDDLYVQAPFRNRGLGAAALRELKAFCGHHGVRALSVEVGLLNAPAQALYRRLGFAAAPNRQVLTLALANPTHRR